MSAKLIVLEGLDGSGKATQTQILYDRCRAAQKSVTKISFPNYDSRSSELVKMYLDGEIGPADEVNAYAASSFYTLDRYISFKTLWRDNYKNDDIILADRYTTSNFCYQMAKLADGKWDGYISWLADYEYNLIGLPEPDMVIYLDMHPSVSQKLINRRVDETGRQKDLHESDFDYLMRCRRAALYCAKTMNWHVVTCYDEHYEAIAPDSVARKVWRLVGTIC